MILLNSSARKNNSYLCQPILGAVNGQESLVCPLDLDTEFKNLTLQELPFAPEIGMSKGVTVQMQPYFVRQPLTLTHRDQAHYLAQNARNVLFPVVKHGVAWVDILQYYGYTVSVERCQDNAITSKLPLLTFVLYFHYSLEDVYKSLTPEYQADFNELLLYGYVHSGRRIRAGEAFHNRSKDSLPMPWILTLDGYRYRIAITLVDTAAVQGRVSLSVACENVGMPMPHKNLMQEKEPGHNRKWITRMDEAYSAMPDQYKLYAEGDLVCSPMLERFNSHMQTIWNALGIGHRFEPSKLSLGSTVKDIAQNIIHVASGDTEFAKPQEFFETYCYKSSADYLRKLITESAMLLCKTDGGRCANATPALTRFTGVGVDIDIKGCYAQGLRNQRYPIGRPMIMSYDRDSTRNKYATLREFLTVLGWNTKKCQLVPGLWAARVSTPDGYTLEHPQDLIPSWVGFNTTDMNQYRFDTEIKSFDDPNIQMNIDTGTTKIFTHHIKNGILTHDILQWILTICGANQRKELLDSLLVESAMVYPASQHVANLTDLQAKIANHDAQNELFIRFEQLPSITRIERECYAWYATSLGDLMVDRMLAERLSYSKDIEEQKPLNTLYKLVINTLYGDIVSPHFALGNVCVSNNVTAKARLGCWATEKALNGKQSITDGCPIDINKVVYANAERRLTAREYYKLYRKGIAWNSNKRHTKFDALGQFQRHELQVTDGQIYLASYSTHDDTCPRLLPKDEACKWISKTVLEHVRSHFGQLDIYNADFTQVKGFNDPVTKDHVILEPFNGVYDYEVKMLYGKATFHGAANQMLVDPTNPDKPDIRMRSYEKREHQAIIVTNQVIENDKIVEGTIELTNFYHEITPAQKFLQALSDNPHSVPRAQAFYKTRLLQVGEYQHKKHVSYRLPWLHPGCEIPVVGLLREFSPSQFYYRTEEQYRSIEREYERSKRRYGQYIEAYFVNEDGTLDYQRMCKTVVELLDNGETKLIDALDQYDHMNRNKPGFRKHPAFAEYDFLRQHFAKKLSMEESRIESIDHVEDTHISQTIITRD